VGRNIPVSATAGARPATTWEEITMGRVLLIGAVVIASVSFADARSSNPSGSDHHLVLLQPALPDDDDPELIRPGPRGDDGEPIQLRPPGWRPDEDEVVEALPVEPEPQLDDNEGE
jgi:hypothetical protein